MVDEFISLEQLYVPPSFFPKLQLSFAAHICNLPPSDWQLPLMLAILTAQQLWFTHNKAKLQPSHIPSSAINPGENPRHCKPLLTGFSHTENVSLKIGSFVLLLSLQMLSQLHRYQTIKFMSL